MLTSLDLITYRAMLTEVADQTREAFLHDRFDKTIARLYPNVLEFRFEQVVKSLSSLLRELAASETTTLQIYPMGREDDGPQTYGALRIVITTKYTGGSLNAEDKRLAYLIRACATFLKDTFRSPLANGVPAACQLLPEDRTPTLPSEEIKKVFLGDQLPDRLQEHTLSVILTNLPHLGIPTQDTSTSSQT